jgi:hypothetical protein
MKMLSRLFFILLLWMPQAFGQTGEPVQSPNIEPAGSFILYPSFGVVESNDADNSSLEISLAGRGRYSLSDAISVNFQGGMLFGDFKQISAGVGAKYQLLSKEKGGAFNLSFFAQADSSLIDLGIFDPVFFPAVDLGNEKLFSFIVGPLFGTTVKLPHPLILYGGFGAGVTYVSVNLPDIFGFGVLESSDNFGSAALLGGVDVELKKGLQGFAELSIALNNIHPDVVINMGLSWRYGSNPFVTTPTTQSTTKAQSP